jgi:CRP/FNR family transcriptional regulator
MDKLYSLDNLLKKVALSQNRGNLEKATKTFERGETIFTPGEIASELYFSLEGVVKISRLGHTGKEMSLALLPANSIIGLWSVMSNKAEQMYRAVAFTPATIICASWLEVEAELRKSPELSRLMLEELSSRLLKAEMSMESLLQRQSFSRLVSFLLLLSCDFGIMTRAGIKINLPLTHKTLGELIGLHRSSVSSILRELQEQHLITIRRKIITIHNPQILSQKFSCLDPALL